jgi:hypothetical protein
MPVANRPEMLALSLERLSQANQLPADIRIYADTRANLEEVRYCRDTYLPQARLFQRSSHVVAPSGCFNILESIRDGYNADADLVFLVEEDILVRQNYFQWHLEIHTKSECLASCGRKDPNHYPLYGPLYTNPGSCLRRELIEQIIPHINDQYFTRLRDYLDEHFGPWDTQSMLDDGLIRRVIRQMGGRAVYPETAVCAHQGFRLYNKIDIYMNQEIGIEKRIARLREIISKIRPGDRYARDFEPF